MFISLFLIQNTSFLPADIHTLSREIIKRDMKCIIIIDDHAELRQTLREMFEEQGYEIIEAGAGREGIKLYRQSPADLVITNVVMPEMDGVEIIRELKRDFPDVRVIAISGDGKALDAHYCLAAMKALGAMYVFAKPFVKEELLRAVHELLGCEASC